MDLLEKLHAIEKRRAAFAGRSAMPGDTVIERVLGPGEVIIQGRPTLMFGSNNYLGLTLHPDVVAAAQRAAAEYGTGTTGSRTANGTLVLHEDLERAFADWFGKRYALIFSTGYQANLSLIGGLCGPGDVILIDSDSHASIYDATRQTASQVIGFRHNSPQSLRKKLDRLGALDRNRLVVCEGLYSIRGDVAPLREIVEVCRAYGAYLLVDEAHSLGTYGATGLGCAEDQGILEQVDFVVGTFSILSRTLLTFF
jgi:8-amino-7-oxononanoate synthase